MIIDCATLSVARSTGAPEHMAHSHWHALFAASARAFKMYDELAEHFVVETPPGVISTNASKYLPVVCNRWYHTD